MIDRRTDPHSKSRNRMGTSRRRTFLKCAAVLTATPVFAASKEEGGMYGLITKIAVVSGRRDEVTAILKESASGMEGCLSYIVAKDAADQNAIWVTEVWTSLASHDAALSLPSVRNGMARAKDAVSAFDRIAVTSPIWGAGLPVPR